MALAGQPLMVLAVDPAVEQALDPHAARALVARRQPARPAPHGLCVSPSGLDIDYDTLLSTSMAYWRAHGGAAPARATA